MYLILLCSSLRCQSFIRVGRCTCIKKGEVLCSTNKVTFTWTLLPFSGISRRVTHSFQKCGVHTERTVKKWHCSSNREKRGRSMSRTGEANERIHLFHAPAGVQDERLCCVRCPLLIQNHVRCLPAVARRPEWGSEWCFVERTGWGTRF